MCPILWSHRVLSRTGRGSDGACAPSMERLYPKAGYCGCQSPPPSHSNCWLLLRKKFSRKANVSPFQVLFISFHQPAGVIRVSFFHGTSWSWPEPAPWKKCEARTFSAFPCVSGPQHSWRVDTLHSGFVSCFRVIRPEFCLSGMFPLVFQQEVHEATLSQNWWWLVLSDACRLSHV